MPTLCDGEFTGKRTQATATANTCRFTNEASTAGQVFYKVSQP